MNDKWARCTRAIRSNRPDESKSSSSTPRPPPRNFRKRPLAIVINFPPGCTYCKHTSAIGKKEKRALQVSLLCSNMYERRSSATCRKLSRYIGPSLESFWLRKYVSKMSHTYRHTYTHMRLYTRIMKRNFPRERSFKLESLRILVLNSNLLLKLTIFAIQIYTSYL